MQDFYYRSKVENEGDAEETFSTLMGETVEHRRNFYSRECP